MLTTVAVRTPATIAAATLTLLAGCSSEDDAALRSPNRGTGSTTEDTTVENAYIVPAFVPGRCALQLDAGAALRFTVTNNRETESEKLLAVSVDSAGEARVPASPDIPPTSTIAYGQPTGPDAAQTLAAVRVDRLDPGLKPAMTTDVTFSFERAGDVTIPVAVEACPAQTP
ncbi:hypothetical protein GR927_20530 [Mycolicibacterium sp. 3033]|nr:hypothetical protein [Mycolicibacterium aurantiacum]